MSYPPALPAPRASGRYAVALVCLGNICRSPMAHVVLEDRLARAGLSEVASVRSSGTAGWHVGQPMDERAAATLRTAGYDPSRHRARQYDVSWASTHDLVLAMDAANLADLADVGGFDVPAGESGRLRLFRDFDLTDSGAEVPDPYYGGDDGFADVLAMVERTGETLTGLLSGILTESEQPT